MNQPSKAKRKGRIRPVSTARSKIMSKLYMPMKRKFLKEFPGAEVHHMRGRTGTLLIDTRFWLAVSPKVHQWIHNNMEEARNLGVLCGKGEWGVAPKDEETARLKQLMREATTGK